MCLGNYCSEYVVILGKLAVLTPSSGTYSGLYPVHAYPSPKGIMPGARPGMMSEIRMALDYSAATAVGST
jgi:hypothetical protein